VDRQGVDQFTSAERTQLMAEYVRLVARFGVACSANICGNVRLQNAVNNARNALLGQVSERDLNQFRQLFQDAARRPAPSDAPLPNSVPASAASRFEIFEVPLARIAELGSRARDILFQNLRFLAALSAVVFALAGIVAWGKRRRQADWSELHLNFRRPS
jgi:hypothetical protein